MTPTDLCLLGIVYVLAVLLVWAFVRGGTRSDGGGR